MMGARSEKCAGRLLGYAPAQHVYSLVAILATVCPFTPALARSKCADIHFVLLLTAISAWQLNKT
jgi:hypothetical protein